MDNLTDEQKKLLSNYCTNTDKNVFGLINLPQVVAGALFSRYSRSTKSLRETLLNEFILNKEMEFEQIAGTANTQNQFIATQKAEKFYDRVLIGFGDDSVAELGGAHMAFEQISNLATKCIQDARLGVSPLEKSTRYVYFDQKDENNNYKYYRGKELVDSLVGQDYIQICDELFVLYSKLQITVKEKLQEQHPKTDDVSDRAYESVIRAKTCDILRGLLPAATLTNTGLYANGRAYEYLLTRMYSSNLQEMQNLAKDGQDELTKIIPSFVKRANNHHGQAQQQYWKNCKTKTNKLVEENYLQKDAKTDEVQLIEYDKDAQNKLVAAILFESGTDYIKAKELTTTLSDDDKQKILDSYVGERKNRRHKPGRAFEHIYYTFAFCANFGQYRDLHRHRILSQQRQLLSCDNGYDVPQDLIKMNLDSEFIAVLDKSKQVYDKIKQELGAELAQYVVPMAYKLKWYMQLNLREAFHFIELRSAPQGHVDYRRVALKMHKSIQKVHPKLANYLKFVDDSKLDLERLESEKRIDKKLHDLQTKAN